MKNRLLPIFLLAGLGMAGAAAAKSSVTVYGTVDGGYGFEQYRYHQRDERASATHSGFRDGYLKSDRIGFKGSEDISENLRVLYHLESEFHVGTGETASSTNFYHRKSIVGLSGKRWGTLTLGRQKDASDDFMDLNVTKSLGKMKRTFGGHGVRRDNMIKYLSPEFSGLRIGVGYAPGGVDPLEIDGQVTNSDREHFFMAGAHYTAGALQLAASLDRERANDKSGRSLGYTVSNWILSAAYDFGHVELYMAYGRDRNGKMKSPGNVGSKTFGSYRVPGLGAFDNDGFRASNYYIGVSAPMSGGRIGLSWTRTSSNLARTYATVHPGQTLAAATQQIVATTWVYPLSKRTRLYAYAAAGKGLAYIDGLKEKEAGFGLNHRF